MTVAGLGYRYFASGAPKLEILGAVGACEKNKGHGKHAIYAEFLSGLQDVTSSQL